MTDLVASRGVAQPGDRELSIVIVSYECRDLVLACLASLSDQRATVDMEVLLYDNASTDGTADAVRTGHDWVELHDLNENVGFGRANNAGFAASRGRAILALNPDTVVPVGALRECLDELWRNPDVGVLSPRLVDQQGRLDRACKRGYPTIWSSFCYFTGLDRRLQDLRSTRYTAGHLREDQVGDVESVSGAFMLMPRRAYETVGGFDEQFFMYAEDIDLCLRIIEAGYCVRYWPRVDVIHIGAGSNIEGSRPPAADAAYFRTMAPFIRKHEPGVRGVAKSLLIGLTAEVMFAVSRLRRLVRLRA